MEEKKGLDVLFEAIAEKENFKEFLDLGKTWINQKTMDKKEEFKIGISDRLYSIVVLAVCLGAVTFLAYKEIINGVSTGTLIGAIIGYALGRTNKED